MSRKKFVKEFLNNFNASPKIIDVGARTGLEDNLLFLSQNIDTKILGFEPEPLEFERLSMNLHSNLTLLNTALYSSKKEITLYVTKDPGLSSIYKPKLDFLKEIETKKALGNYTVVKEIKVEANTLDDEVNSTEFKNADFIKIDTEGSEVDILKGSEKLLSQSLIGVESEMSYIQLREEQPTFQDLIKLLHDHDFQIFDTRNKFQKRESGQSYGKRKGQLIYCDALFFKSLKGIDNITKELSQKDKKTKICNSIAIITSYGYFDYAYEIFNYFKDIFNEDECKAMKKSFKNSEITIMKLPYFPGRGFIGLIFYKIGMIFSSGHYQNRSANRFGDNNLGNIDWW